MNMYAFDPKHYPRRPGCYLMKDTQGTVLYVGKSKNLRRRLSSYFGSRKKDWRTKCLVARVAEIEVIIVNNEVESLVLESNLVKHHRPRFNRMLMGDATGYPYIVLTEEEYLASQPVPAGQEEMMPTGPWNQGPFSSTGI